MAVVGAMVLLPCGLVLLLMSRRIAAGTFRRNAWSGIRVEATMRSEAAWSAAHRAALPWFRAAALCCGVSAFILAALAVTAAPDPVVSVVYVASFLLVALLVLLPVPRAVRAAKVTAADHIRHEFNEDAPGRPARPGYRDPDR